MRDLVVALTRRLVDIFYRRVEVRRLETVPAEGPLLLVANHFNSLVDPMLVLSILRRPVVFVAKSTLWRIPLLKTILDLLGVVPVIRKADVVAGGEPGGQDRNEASFQRLAGVLRQGGAVLIFPEGRSHSDPALSPVRTGAARILNAACVPATVLPLGFWFTRKEEFRSEVLVEVGDPVRPAEPTVEGWTQAIRDGLEAVTLNADSWRDHDVVAAVEGIYGEKLALGPPGLETTFRNRQLLLRARDRLEDIEPGAVTRLARRARAFARLLSRVGLSASDLDGTPARGVLARILRFVLVAAAGFPFALLGVVAYYAPYRSCGIVAGWVIRRPEMKDQIALMKILVGLVAFPLFTALWVGLSWMSFGRVAAVSAAVLVPVLGLLALSYLELLERDERDLRAAARMLFGPGRIARLRAERDTLRVECDRLAGVYQRLR